MTAAEEQLVAELAEALRQHQPWHHSNFFTGEPDWFSCGPEDDTNRCDWVSDPESEDVAGDHFRHVTEAALLPLVLADRRRAVAEELRAIVLDAQIVGEVMHEHGPIRIPISYLEERADAVEGGGR